ncbi:MAG: hypothetical protein DMG69_00830 [Acidobacteria bacterium]|nr:MAG: hypothetical protein DMG69_00830 [Acidobacteriota bacterium]
MLAAFNSARHRCRAACVAVALSVVYAGAKTPANGPSISELRVEKVVGSETGGAVLDVGRRDAFDGVWATCPSVLFDGKQYRMWYSSFYDSHMGRGGIGMATSADGIHWTRANNGDPVLTLGAPGSFDDGQVMGPFVMRDGGVYRMWYTGMNTQWHSSGIGFYRIGLATSRDGVHWTRANGGHPVFDIGPPGANDEVQAATPNTLRESGGYRMWYAAWSPKTGHTICSATSRDGIQWQREEEGRPVTGLVSGGQYGPAVTRVGSTYLMLYMSAGANESRGLFAATSSDGRRWIPIGTTAAIAPGAPPAFDSALAGHASLLVSGDRLKVWYTGYRSEVGGTHGWKLRIGAATIALRN